jgi:muramoyltetrapeptide carboxypeptidase
MNVVSRLTPLKPPCLKQGDTLGLVAPSLPLLPSSEADYQAGKQTLESLGFRLQEGRTVHLRRWWSAGTPEEQAADINEMFANPAVQGIVALAGGFSAIHVLDLLDYDLIRRNPKPFIGMSDNTFYHLAMYSQCGLVGFQGNAVIEGFGECYQQHASATQQALIADLYTRLLSVPKPLGAIPQLTKWESWRDGVAEGRLFGGTLRRLTGLAGTRYFPPLSEFDGAILFWEEIGETLYDISLNLRRLQHMGILERIGGMLIGKLVWVNRYFDEIEHPTPKEAVLDVLSGYTFPILAEVDFGHRQTMVPLPIGITARMDSAKHLLELTETAVSGG